MVRVQAAGKVAAAMNAMRPRPQIAVMRETLGVWYPLFDRLVALWCDTVDGDLPRLAPGSGTDRAVTGGWPCRRWPADWAERRRTWLADSARRRTVTSWPAATGPPRVTSRGCEWRWRHASRTAAR